MKKGIALFLIVTLLLSLTGCPSLGDIVDSRKVEYIDDGEVMPMENYETKATKPFWEYNIALGNNNRDVRIRREEGGKYIYLIDRELSFEDFKRVAIGNLYTEDDLRIMHAMYLAQDIGVDLLAALNKIKEAGSDVREFLQYSKSSFDTAFALIENADETKDKFPEKHDFLVSILGEEATAAIEEGEEAEEIVGLIRAAVCVQQFIGTASQNDGSVASLEEGTKRMLDVVDHVFDLAPDELLIGSVYSWQLGALKQSCEKYFDACESYLTLLSIYDAVAESMPVTYVFVMGSDTDPEWSCFSRAFSGGDIRSCWGDACMPTLREFCARLARPAVSGGQVSLYEEIVRYDALHDQQFQNLIAKYIEFRIHYEFEQLTGITLECYYDLLKPKSAFLWFGTSYNTPPWKKGIDPDDYAWYDPVIVGVGK